MMTTAEASRETGTPSAVYRRALTEHRSALEGEQKRDRLLGYTKVALLAVLFCGAIALFHHPAKMVWLGIPLAGLVGCAAAHEHVLTAIRRRNRVLAFYERGLERLSDRWAGTGEAGDRFLDALHPYARDLDIFGKGSLFELLCTARTRAGEETLAQWLLQAAPLNVIRARQEALSDLRERVQFRERLFATSDSARAGVHPEKLANWGETERKVGPLWLRPAMLVLALLWIASAIYWAISGIESQAAGLDWVTAGNWHWVVGLTVVNWIAARFVSRDVETLLESTETATVDLKLLASVLEVLEQERFHAPLLRELQAGLQTHGTAPSAAIRRLDRIVQYIESRRNFLIRIFNRPLIFEPQAALAAEAWLVRYGASIRRWLAIVGEMEALAALGGWAYEHPAAVFPEFVAEGPQFDAEGFAHPLLPESRAVRNDLQLDATRRLVIVSGPNMAGKSTFVRAVGINAVLAQCGAMVQAGRLRLSPLAVGASICVLDSLQGGVSRFYAEIQRLKLISDLTQGPMHVMFLLDELLSGTNSHDRRTGTEYLVRALVEQGAVGLITTHDLALTEIPEAQNGVAVNCHFEDHLEDGKLIFDYRLKPGVVQTSNALRLMQQIGLAVGDSAAQPRS
ncbi:MAG TPA: mismatch repair protein [Acidobacteriaceae bacterium]